jgi:hypothetical protein
MGTDTDTDAGGDFLFNLDWWRFSPAGALK